MIYRGEILEGDAIEVFARLLQRGEDSRGETVASVMLTYRPVIVSPRDRFYSFVLDLRLSVRWSNGPNLGVSGKKSVVEICVAREIGKS